MMSRERLEGIILAMNNYRNYIRDDYQRYGYDNFLSALELVLYGD